MATFEPVLLSLRGALNEELEPELALERAPANVARPLAAIGTSCG